LQIIDAQGNEGDIRFHRTTFLSYDLTSMR
jgi:hypothetical protein